MTSIENGRKLIKGFMKENNISMNDLASAYGKTRVWVQRALSGYDSGRAVNLFVLEVIRDYKIRETIKQTR